MSACFVKKTVPNKPGSKKRMKKIFNFFCTRRLWATNRHRNGIRNKREKFCNNISLLFPSYLLSPRKIGENIMKKTMKA